MLSLRSFASFRAPRAALVLALGLVAGALTVAAPARAADAGTPLAPRSASVRPGDGTASLRWSAPLANGVRITGYAVTPKVDGRPQEAQSFGPDLSTQVVTGLRNGATYTFSIVALSFFGPGPAATVGPVTIGIPGIAAFPTAQPGGGSARVSWWPAHANGVAVRGYVVTPVHDGHALEPVRFADTRTSQVIDGLDDGGSYAFRVAALSDAGTGPVSTTAPVTVGAPGIAAFPSAEPGEGRATVRWWRAAPNGAPVTGYVVTPVLDGVAQDPVAFDSAATTQVIDGLVDGGRYTFRVAAVNAIGRARGSGTPPIVVGAPGRPTDVGARAGEPGSARVTVRWRAPQEPAAPITGYRLLAYRDGVVQPAVALEGTATSRTVDVELGSTYVFRVAARNDVGDSAWSAATRPVTAKTAPPGSPTDVVARAGNGRATVEWSAPVDTGSFPIEGYLVTPSLVEDDEESAAVAAAAVDERERPDLEAVRVDATSTTLAVEGLRNDVAYRFTVTAVSAAGAGEPSPRTDAVTPSVPPAGTDGTIDIIGDSITVQATSNRADEFAAQGQPEGADLVTVAVAGSRFGDHRPGEHDRVWQQSRPSVLVVALGTNDANALADGWTPADEVAFRELIDTPSPQTCVVVVLPAVGEQAGAAQLEQFARARRAMRSIVGERDRSVVADWGAVIAEHPEYLYRDGVHLALDGKADDQLANPDAADAFAANLWAGVQACPA